MLGRVFTFAIDGITCHRVMVEADVRHGLPSFTLVGLADKAVREARERARAALVNCGYQFPLKRITVNLAPAHLRKVGAAFDLPLAVAVLVGTEQLPAESVEGCAFVGELSMNGELRSINGALPVAEATRRTGLERLFLPAGRAREAALVDGIEIVGVESLQEAVAVLRGYAEPRPIPDAPPVGAAPDEPDLSELRGHNGLIPAVEAAVAGGHNLFLHGPPGTGKTMLARRVPGLLPTMSHEEAIDVTRIHSIAGKHDGSGLIEVRPFRSPHHTISAPGLVGGGAIPLPGEITLAHHGVLFLDELSEFGRAALEALRQPLEDGRVVVVRAQRVITYPTRCMLVAASNPCPCGQGEPRCTCSAADVARYQRRLSGPLLDRIDVTQYMPRPTAQQMRDQAAPASAEVRARVAAARAVQARRFAGSGITCNAQMTPRMMNELVRATTAALHYLNALHDRDELSARGYHRVLRLARTIADLQESERVEVEHVQAASTFRSGLLDGSGGAAPTAPRSHLTVLEVPAPAA